MKSTDIVKQFPALEHMTATLPTPRPTDTFDGESKSMKEDGIGKFQSPIALDTATLNKRVKKAALEDETEQSENKDDNSKSCPTGVLLKCKFTNSENEAKVVNTGATVRVDWEKGMSATLNDMVYDLIQFHFHWPSEHVVNGKRYPVELHLVHSNRDAEAKRDAHNAQLLVIGLFFEFGNKSGFIEQFLDHIPETKDDKEGECALKSFELSTLADEAGWHYDGSLTTPPFHEGVNWFVSSKILSISTEQLSRMIKTNMVKANNRQVQEEFGRTTVACSFDCCA